MNDLGQDAFRAAVYINHYPQYQFVRALGDPSSQGGALLFRETILEGQGYQQRHVVAKYYDEQENEADEEYYEWEKLVMLRGSKHIIQLLGEGRISVANGHLALLMEYSGHGTLDDLISRIREDAIELPNRLLWSFFLCLVQACIAMEYPPEGPVDGRVQQEFIPLYKPNGITSIRHNDLHEGNVLIAAGDPSDVDHGLGPMLKVIDFGYATFSPSEENPTLRNSAPENLFSVGLLMQTLALGESYGVTLADRAGPYIVQVRNSIGGLATFQTRARRQLKDAALTEDLRDLIHRCLARFTWDRPSLQSAQRICFDAVTNRSEFDYAQLGRDALYETDHAIQQFIQIYVLDAEVEEEVRRLMDGMRHSMPNPTAANMAGEDRRRADSEGL